MRPVALVMPEAKVMRRRTALTLLELVIVIAILGLLAALTLPAIQNARESALRAKSQNNLRQIALGFHDYAAAHSGQLPRTEHSSDGSWRSRLFALVLHIEGPTHGFTVDWLLSPADPTVDIVHNGLSLCSYSMNWQIFDLPNASLPASIPDGLSSTILLAEMYAVCNGEASSWTSDIPSTARIPYFARDFLSLDPWGWSYREPLFTFQIRPCAKPERECGAATVCYPLVAQTPHRGGMLVAMADGSGRSVSPSISAKTYWDLVSPAGGEVIGDDW